ncbi:PRC-barrel domain-containing protein [Azospirillum thermophilum]|uniref:PRC-barrel domain-containing protein n=1 Tax=Azospirillum thermophilum TaxID=2202148 RepID=A0A2S2D0L2_9PROT|nr:PRC-barrel domain-containing protein [Azospirillum thermophilum]AWK90007.1 hypothetical protein DEW08_28850 [Azospirillum thermophilum]
MRRTFIATTAALALFSGAAIAQTSNPATNSPTSSDGSGSTSLTAPMPDTDANKGTTATGTATTGNGGVTSTGGGLTGGQMASADELLGKNVYGRDNEKIGEVEDVILDQSGQAKQLVLSSGGFLGIGDKKVAIDYNAANWDKSQDRITLSGMSRDDIRNMPEFQYDDSMTSLNRNQRDQQGSTAK